MSDPSEGFGPSKGKQNGGGGSVRRARERAEAELLNRSMNPIPTRPINTRPEERSKNLSPQSRRQAPMPPALSASRGNPATIGSAISRPAPMAQNWPLQDDSGFPATGSLPATQRSPPKGPPPQRPPRPKNVPSLLDSSKIQDYTPTLQYRRPPPPPPGFAVASPDRDSSNYGDEPDIRSPNSGSTPRTPSSGDRMSSDRPSTSSSVGSIPDFPVPAVPIQAPAPTSQPLPGRRNQGFGPPPVARRPGTSYYSQSSFVSPIPEEMPEQYGRTGSYASSRLMPPSWGTQPEGYEEELRAQRDADRDGRQGLVRQASLGKKAKPALTTIKSSEDTSQRRMDPSRGGGVGRAAIAAGAAGAAVGSGLGPKKLSPPGTQTSRQARTMPTSPTFSTTSSSSSENDFEKPPIALEEEVPLGRSDSVVRANPGMSDRIPTSRRPPRLNIDAVKEAESRGSLTSLPDLIRRATKLASNLDRGKTASRLGMLDILNAENSNRAKLSPNSAQRRSAGSMSDILASFPPPGMATPTGERNSQWPSAYSPSRLNQENMLDEKSRGFANKQRRQRRRCCGMPLWAFLLLCIVVLLLIAAAVVIPIVLIVLPRQKDNTPAPAAAMDLNNCPNSAPCENGGVSVVSNNQCSCVCTNGFTGQRCTVQSDAACVAKDVANTDSQNMYQNATLGSSLPRLFDSANNNFSVPLNSSRLLSLFSANNLSCTSENALVTLNGVSTKKAKRFILPEQLLDATLNSVAEKVAQMTDHLMPSTHLAQEPVLRVEDEATILSLPDNTHPDHAIVTGEVYTNSLLSPRQATLTSNGIVYAASSTPAPNFPVAPPETASTPAPSAPTASPSPSASSVAPGFQLNQSVFDFARVSVLFIFQKTGTLSAAVNAQEKLQDFFAGSLSNMTMPMNSLPENFVINFSNFTIISSDGTSVGGKGANDAGTSTSTS